MVQVHPDGVWPDQEGNDKVWGWRPVGETDREARVVVGQVPIPEQPHQHKGGTHRIQRGEYTHYLTNSFLIITYLLHCGY